MTKGYRERGGVHPERTRESGFREGGRERESLAGGKQRDVRTIGTKLCRRTESWT